MTRMGHKRDANRILVGKPEEKRPTGRQRLLVDRPPYLRLIKIPQNSWRCIISVSERPEAGAVEMQGPKSDHSCKNVELSGIPSVVTRCISIRSRD
jgi:hypothetical protein